MILKNIAALLRICNTPASIISPFPFFAIAIFLASYNEFNYYGFQILLIGIFVSLLSNFAANLWNHCNDLKEDIAQGKKNILMHPSIQKIAIIIAVFLYVVSFFIVYQLSLEVQRPIYIYFLIWAMATWCYSDNIILKKVTGFRLKEHYIGEFITYGIAWPMYTLSIWSIYSEITIAGEIIIIAFFFFGISALLLKDLKDISGDRKAGLMTFGVVFSPSKLIQYSCYFMFIYYYIILNPFTLDHFNKGILIMIFPFAYFLKNTFFHMYIKNWTLDIGDLKALKSLGYSAYTSILLLGLSTFF